MTKPKKSNDPLLPFFVVTFFDENWEEIDHTKISVDDAGLLALHINNWRKERKKNVGRDSSKLLGQRRAEMIQVELSYGS